jgi:phosphotransferase system IIA component
MTRSSNKNTNISIDKCGTTERYYDFGLHYDLCGMSIEDYIESNNACCCSCGNSEGGGSSTPSKKINTITFTVSSDGYLVAYTAYAPTINISASCVCEGATANFIFNANSSAIVKSDVLPINEKLSVSNVVIEPMEDDKYKYGDYKVVNKTVVVEDVVYKTNSITNFSDLKNIKNTSKSELLPYVVDNDGVVVSFERPADTSFPENFYDEDFDYDAWVAENSFVPVIILNKVRFEEGELEIYIGADNMTKYFVEIDTMNIDGETYSVMVKYTEDVSGVDQYLEYNGIKVCTFSADGEINVKYTIK